MIATDDESQSIVYQSADDRLGMFSMAKNSISQTESIPLGVLSYLGSMLGISVEDDQTVEPLMDPHEMDNWYTWWKRQTDRSLAIDFLVDKYTDWQTLDFCSLQDSPRAFYQPGRSIQLPHIYAEDYLTNRYDSVGILSGNYYLPSVYTF